MKHIKLFEEFKVEEFLGIEFKHTDAKLKDNFYKHIHYWASKPFYLYLGDGEFVKLRRATEEDKHKAYDIIKKQGESDRWKSENIGIYGSDETGDKKFIIYRPDSAISYDMGDTGMAGIGNTAGSSKKMDEFKEIGEKILPEFIEFLVPHHVAQAAA